jgi:hypothetical protein
LAYPLCCALEAVAKLALPIASLFWYHYFMAKSITGTKKRRGRPPSPTGEGEQIGMRWPKPLLKAIDAWRAKQDLSRPAAIRQLVERGLK